ATVLRDGQPRTIPVAAGASLAERTNGVFLGTSVRSDSARALVVQTGTATAIGGVTKLDEIPYDFTRKRLSVVVQEGGRRTLIAKGALDSILAVCTQMQDGTEVMPLDAAGQANIQRRFVGWSEQGYR